MIWDIINDINAGKKDIDATKYDPYIVNRYYSLMADTLYFAQQMNINYDLPKDLQFKFIINTIRPSKRYQKWWKKENDENYQLVREWFGFSDQKTREALSVLTSEQIEDIRKRSRSE